VRDTEPLANNSEFLAASQLRRLACLHCVNQASCSGGFGRCGYRYICININKRYLELGQLNVEMMGRGYAWLDTGSHDSLLDASGFIATLQKRQGLMVACPEEIAFNQQWINQESLLKLAQPLSKISYGQYLLNLLQ